jgi:DNA repair protein RadC
MNVRVPAQLLALGTTIRIVRFVVLEHRGQERRCDADARKAIDGASVHPREIVKIALQKSAAACIVYHNHPSGVADQSQADEQITARVKEVLALIDVRLVDHLVLAGSSVLSFAHRGLL